jgi:uncharacterized C2H2 Zn-finger protein
MKTKTRGKDKEKIVDRLRKFRGKLSCPRCHEMLDDEKLLNRHREYLHGEYEVNDKKYNRLVDKKIKPVSVFPHPPRNDWISRTPSKQTYIWDCWDRVFYQYKKGIGLINDLDTVIADEDSEYYKELIKIINGKIQLKKIGPQPKRPKNHGLPNAIIPEKMKKLPKEHRLCKGCNRIIKIHGPKPTNLLACPNCNRNLL